MKLWLLTRNDKPEMEQPQALVIWAWNASSAIQMAQEECGLDYPFDVQDISLDQMDDHEAIVYIDQKGV